MKYDLKNMGIHFWFVVTSFPAAALIFLILKSAISSPIQMQSIAFQLVQLIVPTVAGYGAVMLMQSVFDTEGCELCFSYPRTKFYWGIWRQFRYYVVIAILIFCLSVFMSEQLGFGLGNIFLLLLLQSFAVMAVSFLGITITKKVSFGLIFLLGFAGIQITLGREYDLFNFIYIFDMSGIANGLPARESFNALIIGIFGYAFGQTWI